MIENVLKINVNVTRTIQKKRDISVIYALHIVYSNQSGWGMSVSLKGCKFEHTELSNRFETFNNDCAIVKEAQDEYLSSH